MKIVLILLTVLALTACKTQTDTERIRETNTAVNEYLTYKPDSGDYWQSPEESLKYRTGDCEDYAILKADALGGGDIHVVYVPDQGHHAILYYQGYYLDNRFSFIYDETFKQEAYGATVVHLPVAQWSVIKKFRF
jgi:hypothetical protein